MTTFPTAQPSDALPLATLNAKGSPPSRRLNSAAQAQDIFWTLHEASLPRLQRVAVIQGNFDGNPPYNPKKRRDLGMAWMPNFNTLEGASRLESAKTPYYDLLSSAPLYADCGTRVRTETVDSASASRSRSEHFDALLRTYKSLPNEFWTMFNDYIGFNKGFLWFPRPDSWHFKRLPWHRVLFPDGTSTDPEEWELFCIEHRWTPSRLFSFTKNEGAAKAMGWNISQVWKAIRSAAPADIRNTYQDPMELQKAFRDQELWLSAKIGVIQSASVFVKEFDGTWSQIMVETTMNPERNPRTQGSPTSMVERETSKAIASYEGEGVLASTDWLLNKRAVAKSIYQIMCPFIFETGDGSVNDLNGLGKKIISVSQATDRLVNETVGSAMMQSSIVLQAVSGAAQAKSSLVQFGGGVCVLPSGFTVQNGTIFGNLEAPLAVSTDLRNRLDTNTGIYRPQFEKPRGNPETATAAQLRFSQGTVLTTSAVNRFYTQLDNFLAEVYRRATLPTPATGESEAQRAARDFRASCKSDGLSDKQIDDLQPSLIRAVRSLGNGSPMMRQQAMSALAQYVPFMGPRGLNNWLIDSIAAFAGPSAVSRYRPIEDQHSEPTQAMREAVSENNDMQTGAQVLWLESDDHEQHAKVHLTAAQGAVQAVLEGGADPAMPFTFLQIAMPHIVQHIAKVPREQVRKALEDAYKQVAAGAKDVFAAAQKQVQQQGQAQSLSFEQQLAMTKAQGDLAISEYKAKGRQELSMKRADMDFALQREKQAREAALQDASTAGSIQRDTASTAASIELEKQKTAAQIENERKKAEAQAKVVASKPKGESK